MTQAVMPIFGSSTTNSGIKMEWLKFLWHCSTNNNIPEIEIAKWKGVISKRCVIFESEQDMTFFLLRWS